MERDGAPPPASDLQAWLLRIEARHPTEIEMGLDRVCAVYTRMDCGRPAAQVITIAGTNGKGSTVAPVLQQPDRR